MHAVNSRPHGCLFNFKLDFHLFPPTTDETALPETDQVPRKIPSRLRLTNVFFNRHCERVRRRLIFIRVRQQLEAVAHVPFTRARVVARIGASDAQTTLVLENDNASIAVGNTERSTFAAFDDASLPTIQVSVAPIRDSTNLRQLLALKAEPFPFWFWFLLSGHDGSRVVYAHDFEVRIDELPSLPREHEGIGLYVLCRDVRNQTFL